MQDWSNELTDEEIAALLVKIRQDNEAWLRLHKVLQEAAEALEGPPVKSP